MTGGGTGAGEADAMRRMHRRRRLLRGATAFLALAIALLALHPALTVPDAPMAKGWTDLVLHAGAFAVLTAAAGIGWRPSWRLAAILATGAILLELAQRFVPGREVQADDAAASLAGVAIGMAALRVAARLAPRLVPPMGWR